jgi:4-oxalomesaconate tautomerase
MPVVVLNASDVGLAGYEEPEEIEANQSVTEKVEQLRLAVGPLMNLGDVTKKTVPKMTLLAPAKEGGIVSTRTFIPHRVHEAIGVFGAVSVATACLIEGSVAHELAALPRSSTTVSLDIEHPSGYFTVDLTVSGEGAETRVEFAALLRTARLLMRGEVFVPSSVWSGP